MIHELWPNFFIVGADKAGTSSLYAYLMNIPGIFMSRYKEPNYFSTMTFGDNHDLRPIRDKKKYLELFKNVKNEKIVGEASPSYLGDKEAPKLIHKVSPEAKILICLRDPVERVYSHYLMLDRLGDMKS
ncbi:MAG: sulfotransferase domain-containing protein, partial [Nitrosopumilaceae archaeon]